MSLKVGDNLAFERTFTKSDVELFTEILGDRGNHERQENNRTAIQASFLCKNQHSKEVLKGNFAGVILH